MVVDLDIAIKARRIDDEKMKLTFARTDLAGSANNWALGLKMSDPYSFESLEAFKTRLEQTFEPPRDDFRA